MSYSPLDQDLAVADPWPVPFRGPGRSPAVSAAKFTALVTRSSDVSLLASPAGGIEYVSPSVRMLGYEPESVIGRSVWDFVDPADLGWLEPEFAGFAAEPGPHHPIEYRVRTADGRWRWVESVCTNLLDDPDVGALVINLRDITGRRSAADALNHREEMYRTIVETSEEGIWIVDDRGITSFANRRLATMLGLPVDRLVGRPVTDFVDAGEVADIERSMVRHGRAAPRELRIRRADAAPLWVLLTGSALRGDDGRVRGALGMVTDVTERKRAEDELARRALRDDLTGLPNRHVTLDRLEQALARTRRRGQRVAVLFLDLDNFKLINDSLGHSVGDQLLVEVAGRLGKVVRDGDTVARLGGDEFVIVCDELDARDDGVRLAERVMDALHRPVSLGGMELFPTASLGIAISPAPDASALLRDAEAAMYRAKDRGRRRYELFDESLRGAAQTRLALLGDLRQALDRSELRLVYQPVVEAATGRVLGVESLMRWDRGTPEGCSPAEFIPVAEQSGLIVELGRWAIEEACREAAALQRFGPGDHPLQVGINLSARQLTDDGLVDVVSGCLARFDLDPRALVLEVTESTVMEDAEASLATLNRLKSLGLRIAIDDFGTGYSSLVYLKRLPVDVLKVDRGFIAGLGTDSEDEAIVASITGLARALSVDVVAEGIESPAQLEAARRLGCRIAQGYLFSSPLRPAELHELLAGATTLG